MHGRMRSHPVGGDLLRDRPFVNETTIDLPGLRSLPAHTFGRQYASFMDHHGFTPNDRAKVQYVEDPDLAFVMQRYRQVHDFLHVLCGLPPTVVGELAVKWYEMTQTGLPMCAMSAFVGPLRLPPQEASMLLRDYVPWAARCGTRSELFMNVYFERHFEDGIDDLRDRLSFEAAPPLPEGTPWVHACGGGGEFGGGEFGGEGEDRVEDGSRGGGNGKNRGNGDRGSGRDRDG